MKPTTPDAILWPIGDDWQMWKFPPKAEPNLESDISEKNLSCLNDLLLAVPSRSVLSMPLWIASQGDANELAELELSSRHLLKKDAEVYTVPILEQNGRSLVLALAATDDEIAKDFVAKALHFEIPARLLNPAGCDLLVWKEQGTLCFAIYRDDQCVFFASTGEELPSASFCGAITRTALRLRAEEVITRLPAKARLIGDFSEQTGAALGHALRLDFEIDRHSTRPLVPAVLSNATPPTARAAIAKRARLKRFASAASIGMTVYAVILLFVALDLAWQRFQLGKIQHQFLAIEPAATSAHDLITKWQKFRSVIDPQTFAIDQLAAVASEIPGEQVRLTQYNYDKGRLSIAGEATDVAQAYEFFERVKKAPLLQDYDWTSQQPQLAGRNKVRFEMEGARPDAKTGEE